MIAATSVLQQQASDIRTQKINWQSYNQSQMISNEDYQCISALDSEKKPQYLKDQSYQSAKTFLNLLSHVSKDTTIQYLLVMIDDMLTVSLKTFFFVFAFKVFKFFIGGPF
jgi:V-type H+-transporting ATPase subunit H